MHTLDADLLLAVKQGEQLYQVSDNEDVVLVDVPAEVAQLAAAAGMSLREEEIIKLILSGKLTPKGQVY